MKRYSPNEFFSELIEAVNRVNGLSRRLNVGDRRISGLGAVGDLRAGVGREIGESRHRSVVSRNRAGGRCDEVVGRRNETVARRNRPVGVCNRPVGVCNRPVEGCNHAVGRCNEGVGQRNRSVEPRNRVVGHGKRSVGGRKSREPWFFTIFAPVRHSSPPVHYPKL